VEHTQDSRRRADRGIVGLVARWQALTLAGFGLVVASLAVLLVLDLAVFAPRTRDLVAAIASADGAHHAMLDQQSGLRGYVASGDELFLEAYERGRSALPGHDDRLQARLDADRADDLLRLRLAQQAWLEGFAPRAIEAGRSGGLDPDGADALLRDGKALFDRYRRAAADLRVHLRADVDDALDDQRDATTLAGLVGLAVALVAAGLGGVRARRLRRQLGGAVSGVRSRLEAIRAGDLEGPGDAPDSGLGEFARIHEGLDAAVADLAGSRRALEAESARVVVHNRQLGQVLRFSREVAGSLNLRYVLRGLCTAAEEIAEAARVVVWVRTEDGSVLEPVADSTGPSLTPVGLEPVAVGEGQVGRAARFGRIHGLDGGDEGFGDATDGSGRTFAVPMVVGAEVVGVLEVTVADRASLEGSTVPVLEALAVQAATAVSAARLHERTEVLAMTDGLTRLPNRRRLEADLALEVSISQRYGRPLAFAMVDVDHFKAHNDALGHQAGDVALQALAQLLAGAVRTGDTVYRYGGEELAVLMRETDAGSAASVAERLRALVAHHFAGPDQPRAVTISVGVAVMPAHASTAEALVATADAALYEAKRAGRDRVVVAGSPPPG